MQVVARTDAACMTTMMMAVTMMMDSAETGVTRDFRAYFVSIFHLLPSIKRKSAYDAQSRSSDEMWQAQRRNKNK